MRLLVYWRCGIERQRLARAAAPTAYACKRGRELTLTAWGVWHGRWRRVKEALELEEGADPEVTDEIIAAAQRGEVKALRIALAKPGAYIDAQDPDSELTALQVCARGGHTGMVDTLVEAGANVEASGGADGMHPAHFAANRGHEGVLAALLRHNAEPEAPSGNSGYSALHFAAARGHIGCVRILRKHNLELVTALADDQKTALNLAEASKHAEVAKELRAWAKAQAAAVATRRAALALNVGAKFAKAGGAAQPLS